jgi:hypothetical protein
MTDEQEGILIDISTIVSILENTDNVYCTEKLKRVKEKLKKEWEKN